MPRRSSAKVTKGGVMRIAGGADSTGVKAANIKIRRAVAQDMDRVVEIDERVTRIAKRDYWRDIFERYGGRRRADCFFLVAEPIAALDSRQLLGYVIGEVRAWEFGSAPCGWVFAFAVDPRFREHYIGEQLLDAISEAFRAVGMRMMRTMVAHDDRLNLAFLRSEGMMAGRYIQLEKELD